MRAYFLPAPEITSYCTDTFIGSVAQGGSVNCDRVLLYPHGNGTHTECVGHISPQPYWIADCLCTVFAIGRLITVTPVQTAEGLAITAEQLQEMFDDPDVKAAVIRTLPNEETKSTRDWSGSNPPYMTVEAAELLRLQGIEHVLIDLPSLDPESDGGALRAHRAFWNYPEAPRLHATITEMCYIPSAILDGLYLVQISVLPLESDASPAQVVLYPATCIQQ
ncbi:MAG: cyclase family protein [Bacteroidota bacterium]|nr:cyclase family protein [Chlorobiota bacterium]MDW8271749.1 cyclase family protein [Bacteroidota bacterium]